MANFRVEFCSSVWSLGFGVIYEAVILDVGFEGAKEKEEDEKTYPVICFFTTLSFCLSGKRKITGTNFLFFFFSFSP